MSTGLPDNADIRNRDDRADGASGDAFADLPDSQTALRRELFTRSMDLLARREHSCKQLSNKLAQRDFDGQPAPAELIEEVVQRLADEELLSDQRFALGFVRSRVEKGHGPERIRAELKGHGVPDESIGAALEQGEDGLAYDWFALAHRAKLKKYGERFPDGLAERAKWQNFLRYRGFNFEQIDYALTAADDE